MNNDDFERRFRKKENQFDRDWERARRWAWVGIVINLAILAFIVWAIVMVMRYFGVI